VSATSKILQQLREFESRNITFMEPDGSWPVVWERAQGVHVWDTDGKKYLDLTAAFGVAAAGHANRAVVKAGQKQMATLLHAMGDVHPHALKAQLARELSRLTFERWSRITGKTIFCNSGFEAVEAALKTALLATGKRGVIAFEKAYHGLGYGALNATHREHFRGPFRAQLREFASFIPFPTKPEQVVSVEKKLRQIFRREKIGAVLVEPIQARGGINIPPPKFLPLLRNLCEEFGALLIADEIYTGFGRTGKWFACEHSGVVPDLICLGKALTGGFPLSACVGRADLMDAAWPPSSGEAIHTSTFLGHPVGCAMALAQIAEIQKKKLPDRAAKLGEFLLQELDSLAIRHSSFVISSRGLGLMAGVEIVLPNGLPATHVALDAIKKLLHRGYIFLPEGEHANVVSFTPPLTITRRQLAQSVAALADVLTENEPQRTLRTQRGKGVHTK
jgi:4-aminobutyrate aminotransferase-like enzyme